MHSLTTAQCFISIFCAKFLILHINTPKVLQNIFFACNHNRNICTRTPLETRTIKCIQQWFRIILVLMPNFRFGLSFSFPFHASYFQSFSLFRIISLFFRSMVFVLSHSNSVLHTFFIQKFSFSYHLHLVTISVVFFCICLWLYIIYGYGCSLFCPGILTQSVFSPKNRCENVRSFAFGISVDFHFEF